MAVAVLASQLLLAQLTEGSVALEFIKSIAENQELHSHRGLVSTSHILEEQHRHRFAVLDLTPSRGRRTQQSQLQGSSQQRACDQSFADCLQNEKCIDCFLGLQSKGINWASVIPETHCNDVTKFLMGKGHCKSLDDDEEATNQFCITFNSCIVWTDGNDRRKNDHSSSSSSSNNVDGDEAEVDCARLTKCDWKGIHPTWVGDGVCHDNIEGCYNTEICNFDGGDCCKDKCTSSSGLKECGHDGYACRDPSSPNCDRALTSECTTHQPDSKEGNNDGILCSRKERKYRLVMYDSFGDGWDETRLQLSELHEGGASWKFGLKEGARGTEFLCLSSDPKCYNVKVSGGTWGNEVSWEIKPLAEGTKSIADGGTPMNCTFAVAGGDCVRTCSGYTNADLSEDSQYKSFKELLTCVHESCVIQVGACRDDPTCNACVEKRPPEYCYANDKFNAVVDCGLCSCKGEEKMARYCAGKLAPGAVIPRPAQRSDQHTSPKACTAAETLAGSGAVMDFSKCANFDQVKMVVTDFNQENFGQLDAFERCAHSFNSEKKHGGRTALGCMQILVNAINTGKEESNKEQRDRDIPAEAIASLAFEIYHNAESFCECASKASADCPLCPSFRHFKSLLYESMDACQALDEIDCDAWAEFVTPCKSALEAEFASVDFRSPKQCEFVKTGCNAALPFPAFRRLDCRREIPKYAWDFYIIYQRECLQGGGGKPPRSGPSNIRTPPPTTLPDKPDTDLSPPKPTNRVTPKPDTPDVNTPSGNQIPKPYSSDDGGDSMTGSANKQSGTKVYSWRLFSILGLMTVVGFVLFKRRPNFFLFGKYHRAPSALADDEMVYSSLGMESEARASFEIPTLSQRPSCAVEQI